jgi:hypothetical protein
MAEVRQLGGAFAAGTGGALCQRDAAFNLFVVGIAPPPDLAQAYDPHRVFRIGQVPPRE